MLDDVFDLAAARSCSARSSRRRSRSPPGSRSANFTFPFLGGLDPGSVDLVDLPGGRRDRPRRRRHRDRDRRGDQRDQPDRRRRRPRGRRLRDLGRAPWRSIALSLDRNAAGVLAALTAGAALGFLRHGFPPASDLHGGHRLQPARLPARRRRRPGRAEDERRDRPLPAADHPRGADPRHRLRRSPSGSSTGGRSTAPTAGTSTTGWPNIGFSQRRTLAYLYGWTLVMALLALALRFVPYSDDHGNFDAALDRGDGRLRAARARRQRLPGRGAGDPQAAPGPAAPAGRRAAAGGRPPARGRGRRAASRASWRPAASPRSTPRRASSRRSIRRPASWRCSSRPTGLVAVTEVRGKGRPVGYSVGRRPPAARDESVLSESERRTFCSGSQLRDPLLPSTSRLHDVDRSRGRTRPRPGST